MGAAEAPAEHGKAEILFFLSPALPELRSPPRRLPAGWHALLCITSERYFVFLSVPFLLCLITQL